MGRLKLASVCMLVCGIYLLSIDLQTIHRLLGCDGDDCYGNIVKADTFAWMDTRGVTLSHIVGNPHSCKDVLYTGYTRDPFDGEQLSSTDDQKAATMILKNWLSTGTMIRKEPRLSATTCFAYFHIASPWKDPKTGHEFHPVWGRLPATALVFQAFPNADVFLYIDSDALLAYPNKSPTDMYEALRYDGKGREATHQHLTPGLIVNKPLTGWLCGECERYQLGHGCFNSGALLWHRQNGAEIVLKTWWESRHSPESENLFDASKNNEGFHGWYGDDRRADKMGEQNRLMYIFATNPEVRQRVWAVPRAPSEEFDSISCPGNVDEEHTPCLQNDFVGSIHWNRKTPLCFISHYADEKERAIAHAEIMLSTMNEGRGP